MERFDLLFLQPATLDWLGIAWPRSTTRRPKEVFTVVMGDVLSPCHISHIAED